MWDSHDDDEDKQVQVVLQDKCGIATMMMKDKQVQVVLQGKCKKLCRFILEEWYQGHVHVYIDGLVQDCSNWSALTLIAVLH